MKNIVLFFFSLIFSANSFSVGVWSEVSLIQLSIKPEEYEGKFVLVSGYFVTSRGDPNMLYLSKDSHLSNSIDYLLVDKVNDSSFIAECNTKCYAKIIGTFTRKQYGTPGYIGGIINVEKVIYLNNGR